MDIREETTHEAEKQLSDHVDSEDTHVGAESSVQQRVKSRKLGRNMSFIFLHWDQRDY